MHRFILIAMILVMAVTPASAQETTSNFDFNNDRFLTGSEVVQDKDGVDDLFMVGATVRSEKDITGNAHLAGRKVVVIGDVGGDAYLSGMDITIEGKVAGDVTIGGYKIDVGEVEGDVRATGDTLTLSAPVSGYALISGDEVNFNSVVKGDVRVAADKVDFADDARIEGKLILYEDEADQTEIPAGVIPEDRVERRDRSEWSGADEEAEGKSFFSRVVGFFRRVLFLTVMAGLIAGFRPQKLADLRRSVLGQPLRNLLIGFVAVAAGIGGAILLMFTGLGFLLVLASLLIAFVGMGTGYVLGSYAVGVGLLKWANKPEPDALRTRLMAAAVGAFAVTLIGKIPMLGGLVFLAVALIGAGALYARVFGRERLEAG